MRTFPLPTHIGSFHQFFRLECGRHAMGSELKRFGQHRLRQILKSETLIYYERSRRTSSVVPDKTDDERFDSLTDIADEIVDFCLFHALVRGNTDWKEHFLNPIDEQDEQSKAVALLRLAYFFSFAHYLTRHTLKFSAEIDGGNFFHHPFAWYYLYTCVANAERLLKRNLSVSSTGEVYAETFNSTDHDVLYDRLERTCETIAFLWGQRSYEDLIMPFFKKMQSLENISDEYFLYELGLKMNGDSERLLLPELLAS